MTWWHVLCAWFRSRNRQAAREREHAARRLALRKQVTKAQADALVFCAKVRGQHALIAELTQRLADAQSEHAATLNQLGRKALDAQQEATP